MTPFLTRRPHPSVSRLNCGAALPLLLHEPTHPTSPQRGQERELVAHRAQTQLHLGFGRSPLERDVRGHPRVGGNGRGVPGQLVVLSSIGAGYRPQRLERLTHQRRTYLQPEKVELSFHPRRALLLSQLRPRLRIIACPTPDLEWEVLIAPHGRERLREILRRALTSGSRLGEEIPRDRRTARNGRRHGGGLNRRINHDLVPSQPGDASQHQHYRRRRDMP